MSEHAMVVGGSHDLVLSAETVKRQVQTIQKVMAEVMKDGEHYGTIPGCGDKKTLFKSGAEKLCMTFRLRPEYKITRIDLPGGHREYEVTTDIYHIASGENMGQGVGNCSTLESKYRYRLLGRVCPKCGVEAIIKGKKEYGGGWICLKSKDGCGQKYKDGDKSIEEQTPGKIEYGDPADYYNTVMKMSKKRSLSDAIIQVTAASDIFAQDLEDEVNQEHRKVEEELKGKGGSKNDDVLRAYVDKVFDFTDEGSLKAWRATNDTRIKTDLSGQGELFAFNQRYAEHLATLTKPVKPLADYEAEIAQMDSEHALNDYWRANNVQAKNELGDDGFAKFKSSWVERKKAILDAASQPPDDVPMGDTQPSAKTPTSAQAKLIAAIEFTGNALYEKALANLDMEPGIDHRTLPDHLCNLVVNEMNALVDKGEM